MGSLKENRDRIRAAASKARISESLTLYEFANRIGITPLNLFYFETGEAIEDEGDDFVGIVTKILTYLKCESSDELLKQYPSS